MIPPVSDFQKDIERHHFEQNGFTIIRLEALFPLPPNFLEDAQRGKGILTTKFGRFSYTKFETWQKALEFYLAYNNYICYGYPIIATPISVPNYTYETLMDHYTPIARMCRMSRAELPVTPGQME